MVFYFRFVFIVKTASVEFLIIFTSTKLSLMYEDDMMTTVVMMMMMILVMIMEMM